MKNLLVLGAGTAGTMVVNRLRPHLERSEWRITIVDQDTSTTTSPATSSSPSVRTSPRVVKPRHRFLPDGRRARARRHRPSCCPKSRSVHAVRRHGAALRPARHRHRRVAPRPRRLRAWQPRNGGAASSTSTPSRARPRSRRMLATWPGGRLVVHITEMPIKCPVAPLEFAFLADAYFRERGMRDKVEITYVTPLDGAFTKPVAAAQLGGCSTSAESRSWRPTSWSSASTPSRHPHLLRRARGPVRPAGHRAR
jgi:sulfide:quinone oxidoreductase